MRVAVLALSLVVLASGGALAQSVGVASAVNQSALGAVPGQVPKTVFMGDQIIHNQKIVTDAHGLLQILLADGTSFTVGPNSSLTIDSFVYDPDKGTAKVVADLGTGLFRFIGGASSKSPDGVTLNTPVGTVGVRGGISNFDFSGAVAYHLDLVYGDGVTLSNGTKVVANIYKSGYSIVFGNDGKVSIEKTPPEWSQAFQTALAGSGKGGGVSGNKVAGNMGGTNQGGTNNNNNNNTPNDTQVASVDNGPIPTWAQINNADDVDVNATYHGTYTATVTPGVDFVDEFEHDEGYEGGAFQATSDMALVFNFATQQGTAYFAEPDEAGNILSDPALKMDVTADSATGAATYSGSVVNQSMDGEVGYLGNVTGTINGFFYNTWGVGTGTLGVFDAHILNGEDGAYDMSGAFGAQVTQPGD